MDIALHPQFGTNKLLYLTYIKPLNEGRFTIALARGRFDGHALMEVRDIFQSMPPVRGASWIAFGADGRWRDGARANRAGALTAST